MDKKLVALMLIFLLSFGLFAVIIVFHQPLSGIIKAREEFLPSPDNSLIFAWPLTSKADGLYHVQINVFVRNSTNLPLPGKKVSMDMSLGTVKVNDVVSDKTGKSTFLLSSGNPGTAEISALIDNEIRLKQKITVKFQ